MNKDNFAEQALRSAVETNKVHYARASDRLVSGTKFGGAPWWPRALDRPRCNANHGMSFVAQIRLGDVPALDDADQRLLSFHYCEECARDGDMPWGWPDDRGRGYDLRVIDTESGMPDGLGCLGRDWIGSHLVEFESIREVASPGDLDGQISLALPDDYFTYVPTDFDEFSAIPSDDIYPGLRHVSGTKLGGWPSWQQNPAWPTSASGTQMLFIAQLDMVLCSDLAWATGAAFLFADLEDPIEAELVIQTT